MEVEGLMDAPARVEHLQRAKARDAAHLRVDHGLDQRSTDRRVDDIRVRYQWRKKTTYVAVIVSPIKTGALNCRLWLM